MTRRPVPALFVFAVAALVLPASAGAYDLSYDKYSTYGVVDSTTQPAGPTYYPWPEDQADSDGDGIPDKDDTIDPWADDEDGDGTPDDEDTFYPWPEDQKDSDGDGIPDVDDTIDPWADDRSCTIKCLGTSVTTTTSPTITTSATTYTRLALR